MRGRQALETPLGVNTVPSPCSANNNSSLPLRGSVGWHHAPSSCVLSLAIPSVAVVGISLSDRDAEAPLSRRRSGRSVCLATRREQADAGSHYCSRLAASVSMLETPFGLQARSSWAALKLAASSCLNRGAASAPLCLLSGRVGITAAPRPSRAAIADVRLALVIAPRPAARSAWVPRPARR